MGNIPELKYYNLCLPREILDTAKSIAAREGLTLKEYFARVIVKANTEALRKGGENNAEQAGDTGRCQV